MINPISVINFLITSASSGQEDIYEVVIHHFSDYVITGGFIGWLNQNLLSAKLFGIFDMRITKLVLMLWVAMFLCIIIFIPLARAIKKNKNGSKSRWANRWIGMWEFMITFIYDEIIEPNFSGKDRKKVTPYFLSLFFFIIFANYLGMIPGLATATSNLAVTGGLALCTLFFVVVIGFIKHGPLWIITGIVPGGIPRPLFPLLWVIEIVGLIIRPFSLTIRLFANMAAGHIVIIAFLFLIMMFQSYWIGIGSVAGAFFMTLLELLVALIQAYIFTALSAMYIGEAMKRIH
jgi:F-type H+-transporting ATPase subunit a